MSEQLNVIPFPGGPFATTAKGGKSLETGRGGSDDGGMSDLPARVAVLEQIAKDTRDTLKEMKDDLRGIRDKQERDFRLGIIFTGGAALALAGLMAKGFHWF